MSGTFTTEEAVERYTEFADRGMFPQEKEAIEKYFVKQGAKVLDIGCGVGRTTVVLDGMGFDVLGIDVSESMIERAKFMYPDINFCVGDACDLEFKNGSFDYVLFSYNGIDYIYPEWKRFKALREIRRILKEGGLFVFSSHNSWSLVINWTSLSVVKSNVLRFFARSHYVNDDLEFGNLITYYINPKEQKDQLEDWGFQLLEIVGKINFLRLFEAWPYYVAKKEEEFQ